MKEIIYSKHAIFRLYQRGISKEQAEQVLEHPDYIISKADNTKKAVKQVSNNIITVIFIEKENYIKVITVY